MEFKWYENDEGRENGFQYVINVEELDRDIYSVDKLIEDIEEMFGSNSIQEIQDDMYFVWLKIEEECDMLESILKKYEEIFEDEELAFEEEQDEYACDEDDEW